MIIGKFFSSIRPIHGVLLSLLPILSMPLMSELSGSMINFSLQQETKKQGKMVVHPEILMAEKTESYSRFERFEETPELDLEKIHLILKDFKTGLPPRDIQKLAQVIYEESLDSEYDPELILAVIAAESSFNNWSRSTMGAIGLMQIMPTTGSSLAKAENIHWMGSVTLFDPYLNIKLGIKYLAMMHDEFGDLQIALTAYNYGPTRVREMLKRCDLLPRAYSQKVLSTYKRYLDLRPQQLVQS
jgi:soluble lytic murein transglycosylase